MLNFLLYMVTALILLGAYMYLYERFTPYRELDEIRSGNVAAAIAFVGAIVGFTLPLVSVIFYTHSVLEMAFWAIVTGAVQMGLFAVMQRTQALGCGVKGGNVACGIMLAGMAISVGMLNAICISY